jgi:hypothetical protein
LQPNSSITRPLTDLIVAEEINPHYGAWLNCPFNIKFSTKKLSPENFKYLQGSAIYLIAAKKVALYLGKYQPKNGNIVKDRLVKHLSTMSARGHRLGFGNQSRYETILPIIKNKSLKKNIDKAFQQKFRSKYFRDSGHTTTINRLRYADANWDWLSKAKNSDLLNTFSIHIFLLRVKCNQSSSNLIISQLEKDILNKIQPICNKEYHFRETNDPSILNIESALSTISKTINLHPKIQRWECIKFSAG